jgi:nucleotide-binding universal stress UspA family protein
MTAMVTFSRVLCPIDFSEPSKRALAYAVAFADWHHARLAVMHVAPTFEPVLVTPVRNVDTGDVVFPVTSENVIEALHRAAKGAGASPSRVEVFSESGAAVARILDRVVHWSADLLVVGTHGFSGFERLLLGSVTERLIHKAPCPVLTVPPSAHAASPEPVAIHRILCPVDFSPSSELAAGFALDLGRQTGAAVTLLHVGEWPEGGEPRTYTHFLVPEVRLQLMADARAQLKALAPASPEGSAVSHHVVSGRPKTRILAYAMEHDSQLIVMGAQGRDGVGLTLLGSTTERVVRDATCPVLTVRGVPPLP